MYDSVERESDSGATPATHPGIPAEQQAFARSVPLAVASTRCPLCISDHELLRLIGVGSYGEVWLARTTTGSFRAVKVVRRASFDHDRPFEREFEGLKKFEPISHSRESQIDIFHVGRNDAAGFFYYIMELADAVERLEGDGGPKRGNGPEERQSARLPSSCINAPQEYVPRTLKHDLRTRGALPLDECLQIGLFLLRALEHLHAHGLVHRDIKPSNIIFVGGVPKLADIGLVTGIDATRSFVGTDGYIPPEGPGTPQADLYSLGKVLYECVTGKDRLDFPELPAEWRTRPDLEQLLEVNEILTRACDANPLERYQNASELLDDLGLLQRGLSIKRKRSSLRTRRVTVRILSAAAVALALVLVGIGEKRVLQGKKPGYRLSPNRQAQKLYDQAGYFLQSRTREGTLSAFTNLMEAVKLDPAFFDAYYELAYLYGGQWGAGLLPRGDSTANQRWANDKMRALQPNSAKYHLVNAWIKFEDWRFQEALSEVELSVKLDPTLPMALAGRAWMILRVRGDAAGARRDFEAAEGLNAGDVTIETQLGTAYYVQGDFGEAIRRYLEALHLESKNKDALWNLAWAYEADKQYTNALAARAAWERASSENSGETDAKWNRLQALLEEQGPRAMWQAMLDESRRDLEPDYYYQAQLCARLGYTNEVFPLLDAAIAQHNHGTELLLIDQCWDELRNDARYKERLKEMGFREVMIARR